MKVRGYIPHQAVASVPQHKRCSEQKPASDPPVGLRCHRLDHARREKRAGSFVVQPEGSHYGSYIVGQLFGRSGGLNPEWPLMGVNYLIAIVNAVAIFLCTPRRF
jgi:hypothetical protein